MNDIKSRAQGMEPSASARNVNDLARRSSNIYESLAIISHRARHISSQIKKELQVKLEEFSSATDTLEEVNENKEQIEISKFYERLPNPATIAMNEFLEKKLSHRYKDTEDRR
jgi:DNA-directed RNA polymerase subunit K/omega